jgi:hypothetical protein
MSEEEGRHQEVMHLLAHRFKGMSFGAGWVSLTSGSIKTTGPIAMEASRLWIGTTRTTIEPEDNQGDNS